MMTSATRYEYFHESNDTTNAKDWVVFTAMVHDGKEFVVYESTYFHQDRMSVGEWNELKERIEKMRKNILCQTSYSPSILNIYECTTYSITLHHPEG